MKEKKNLNKAITDNLSALLEQGVNVNVRVETQTLVRLVFFAIVITVVVAGTNYALHWLKNH